jgi:hypothetical protein
MMAAMRSGAYPAAPGAWAWDRPAAATGLGVADQGWPARGAARLGLLG